MSSLNESEQSTLLSIARQSIEYGLYHGRSLPVDSSEHVPALQVLRASFVTLERNGHLRGCIGMLEAVRPLVEDVARNAFAAAFEDPRFPPLKRQELGDLDLHISVLSPSVAMNFMDEADLIRQLQPDIDGLILHDRGYRGTFLPSVWQQLPDPRQFLCHLKQKAGLPGDYWSDTLTVRRYSTQMFP